VPAATEPAGRWRQLAILAVGLLLAEAPWMSAAAVAPVLRLEPPVPIVVAVALVWDRGASA